MADNLLYELDIERDKYGTLMTDDECINLINTVCYNATDRMSDGTRIWGLNEKNFGVFGTRYDGVKCSVDTILNRQTMHIYDVLIGAGAESLPTWNDLGLHTQTSRPWLAPIEPREPATPVYLDTKLGATLFSIVDLYQYERLRAERTVDRLRDELGFTFLRVFWRKGTGSAGDYWLNEPYYSLVRSDLNDLPVGLMSEVMGWIGSKGLKIAHCVFADNLGMSLDAQDRFVDGFCEAANANRHTIEYVEVFNEPYLYGGGHGGDIPTLHRHARRLRSRLGDDVLIALGTPTAVHQGGNIEAEVRDMYDGFPEANLITVHPSRATNNPQRLPELGPWAPKRRANGEPIGPDSSGAQTKDAAALRANFLETQRLGYEWYVFHADPLIRPRGYNVWDYAEWPAIAATLKEVSGGGTVIPPHVGPKSALLPNQELFVGDKLTSTDKNFTLEYQSDNNLVIYDWRSGSPVDVWSSGTHDLGDPGSVSMQGDGNLVIYLAGGIPVWATGTSVKGSVLELQNQGNAVIYADGTAIWATSGGVI